MIHIFILPDCNDSIVYPILLETIINTLDLLDKL